MQNILCPLDFSEEARLALRVAIDIAERFEATLIFASVLTGDVKEISLNRIKTEKQLNDLVEEVSDELRKNFTSYETVILQGNYARTISEYATERDIDLVVMATSGVLNEEGEFVSSNTFDLIDISQCSVLSIPKSFEFKPFKRIIYASNFEKDDKWVIQDVISFATVFNAQLKVLHMGKEDDHRDEQEYKEFREQITSFTGYSKMEVERRVYKDELDSSLHKYMKENGYDLLVLVSRQRNFLNKLFHKSLTRKMSYFNDFPLMVFKI
jgi:nucleotide-binding universal stress UspA family protein